MACLVSRSFMYNVLMAYVFHNFYFLLGFFHDELDFPSQKNTQLPAHVLPF